MQFTRVIIITPSFEQRVSKMAYGFTTLGIPCEVIAEEAEVAGEFKDYVKDIPLSFIPVSGKLKRTPLGSKRVAFLKDKIKKTVDTGEKILVIARDVNYGTIVGRVIKQLHRKNLLFVTDVADNYDLLYASFSNPVKRSILKAGFSYLTKKAVKSSDALIIVTPVNDDRMGKAYPFIGEKKIIVLRNLPLQYRYIKNDNKIPNSFVYVGKIDEISRDPMYVLENLKDMREYTLHFYSSQKKSTLDTIKTVASQYGMSDRVIMHDRVPYDELPNEISKYMFGLVPHQRSPITDYTVPNKIYDYKSSGIVTIMSDCPSLVEENKLFGFGVVYSKNKDDFKTVVEEARKYKLDFSIPMPTWMDEMTDAVKILKSL